LILRNRHPRLLYLRAGDIVPGEVTKIDEQGVWIRSVHSESSIVPHDKIKAVELSLDNARVPGLSKAKRDRLLTLPRLQKDSPPTHLIGSTSGDYLRGRLVSMDDETVKVEVRLEVREVPRSRVARIIWLHPESLKAQDNKDKVEEREKASGEDAGLRVQAVCRDGIRLTFSPERVADGMLFGKSDVLGTCQVKLKDLDQLLIGKGIEQGTTALAFRQWILNPAPEPNVTRAEGGDAPPVRSSGMASALVGKPAPDFELDLLSGEKFRLAGSKGKVVVLDFWATWCGPCLQAMPQVDRVTQEFRDQDVRLIAVNLQETPKQITAMLERQKMNLTVALDREGRVAELYKANAIPQTVIIDRDGSVARLFVGSSPRLGDELRDALKAVLSGAAKDQPIKQQ
jgi:thiol-disulfide isomerase/thioredoxin